MFSSGQFESEFTAFIECADCGVVEMADCWRDPEYNPSCGFTCSNGHDNRFDVEEDPDAGRDDR